MPADLPRIPRFLPQGQTLAAYRWFRAFVAEDAATGSLVGAAALVRDRQNRYKILLRCDPDFRPSARSRALLATVLELARKMRIDKLHASQGADARTPLCQWWQALGFAIGQPTITYLARPQHYIDSLERLYGKFKERGKIPASAMVVPLKDVPIEPVLELRLQGLGGNPHSFRQRLQGLASENNISPTLSHVLRYEGQTIGCSLLAVADSNDPHPRAGIVDSLVVHPQWRLSWPSIVLRYESSRAIAAAGVQEIRFIAEPKHSDTQNNAHFMVQDLSILGRVVLPFIALTDSLAAPQPRIPQRALSVATAPEISNRDYLRAQEKLRSQQHAEGIAILEGLVAAYPQELIYTLNLGRYYFLLREDNKLRTLIENLEQSNTTVSAIQLGKAYLAFKEGNKAQALDHLQTVRSHNHNSQLQIWIGQLYCQLRHWANAEAAFAAALEKYPCATRAYLGLARVALHTKKLDRALDRCQQALEIDAQSHLAHYYRGIAHLKQDAVPEAIAALQQCLEIQPYYGVAHRRLARIYLLAGEPVKAAEHQIAAQIEPRSRQIVEDDFSGEFLRNLML